MGYLKDIAQEFREVLYEETSLSDNPDDPEALERIVTLVKNYILESYKNGIVAGKLSMAEKQSEKLVKESLEE